MDSRGGPESLDPARVTEVSHETAAVIVRTGRAAHDPELTSTLVPLVDELGLSTLAELWADRHARGLPWRCWHVPVLGAGGGGKHRGRQRGAAEAEAARSRGNEMCRKLLAKHVIEDVLVQVEPDGSNQRNHASEPTPTG